MWKVLGFQTKAELEKYLNDNAIPVAKIIGFTVDVSGQYVVLIAL